MHCLVPMKERAFLLSTPLGRRWKSYSTESTTTVCPALLPPCRHETHSRMVVVALFLVLHNTVSIKAREFTNHEGNINNVTLLYNTLAWILIRTAACIVFSAFNAVFPIRATLLTKEGRGTTTGQQLTVSGL